MCGNLINQRAEPLSRYKTCTTSWRVFETLHVFFVTNFTVQDHHESAEFSNVCLSANIRVQRFLHILFEQEYFCGAFFYQFHYIFMVTPIQILVDLCRRSCKTISLDWVTSTKQRDVQKIKPAASVNALWLKQILRVISHHMFLFRN